MSQAQPQLVDCRCCKGDGSHEVKCDGSHYGGGGGYAAYNCSACDNDDTLVKPCRFCSGSGKIDPDDEWTGVCSVRQEWEVRE